MVKLIVLLGSDAGATQVADLIGDCAGYELVAFADNLDRGRCRRSLAGRPIVWVDELERLAATHQAVCAMATVRRVRFCEQVEALGMLFATVVHPRAHLANTASVGAGTILSPGALVAASAQLGRQVFVNRGCLIGHDTRIGDYVTLGSGANVAGRVEIGDGAFVGMGAIVLDRLTVGSRSIVGAGAVVTRDVPPNVQVQGSPARIVKRGVDGR